MTLKIGESTFPKKPIIQAKKPAEEARKPQGVTAAALPRISGNNSGIDNNNPSSPDLEGESFQYGESLTTATSSEMDLSQLDAILSFIQFLLSFLEQKSEIIAEFIKALEPTPEEIDQEKKDELNKLEKKILEAKKETRKILEELLNVLAVIKNPNISASDKAAIVSSAVQSISARVDDIVNSLNSALSDIQNSGVNFNSVDLDGLVSAINDLTEKIGYINSTCDDLSRMI